MAHLGPRVSALLDGQLGRIDVAFVREDGPFRQDHRYATEDQLRALQRAWGY